MHPPSAVCKAVSKLPRSKLRLAWHGPKREFAVVQLYHIKDVNEGFQQEWDPNNGPVYGKDGRRPDWDTLFFKPMFIGLASDFDCDTRQVMNGQIEYELLAALSWAAEEQWKKNRTEGRKALEARIDDVTGEMADFLWSKAQNTGETSIDVPWATARNSVEDMYHRKNVAERQLRKYYG